MTACRCILGLGDIQYAQGKLDDALKTYEEAVALQVPQHNLLFRIHYLSNTSLFFRITAR